MLSAFAISQKNKGVCQPYWDETLGDTASVCDWVGEVDDITELKWWWIMKWRMRTDGLSTTYELQFLAKYFKMPLLLYFIYRYLL